MSRNKDQETSDFFIGARLGKARAAAGISLEQAAKATRIRVLRLKEIESDDFSGFAHPTYARLFLIDYANYLGVPEEEIRPMLPDTLAAGAEGFQYLDALTGGYAAGKSSRKRQRKLSSQIFRVFLIILAVIVISIAAITLWITWRKLEAVWKSAPLQGDEAVVSTPSPSPAATPEPSATPEIEQPTDSQLPAASPELPPVTPENSTPPAAPLNP